MYRVRSSHRTRRALPAAAVLAVLVAVAACGRSSGVPTGSTTSSASASVSSPGSSTTAGDIGTLKNICGPGTPKGGSGRGVTKDSIELGTLGDASSALQPGLGQEFFDAADAFSKWCNAAGGINGRKLVINKLDAQLSEGAARILEACRKDFMLVGGGNVLDAPDLKPRLACKLGQIPAYVVDPASENAPLQVLASSSPVTVYQVGGLRLLADRYPAAKTGLAIANSTVASLAPQGERAAEAYQKLGYKISIVQPRPFQVASYRAYMEQLKSSGSKADYEIYAEDALPIVTAMNDVGYSPAFVLFSVTFYSPNSVKAAQNAAFPPSYVALQHVPFELASQFPAVQEIKTILKNGVSSPKYTDFTAMSFSAWMLWARAATECGDNLTQACVLEKAAAHPDWNAGGLYSPHSTEAGASANNCLLMVRLTKTGWVYDKDVTKPTNGVFNCDPSNNATVKSYLTQ